MRSPILEHCQGYGSSVHTDGIFAICRKRARYHQFAILNLNARFVVYQCGCLVAYTDESTYLCFGLAAADDGF